jgi:hypothetical protein
MFKMRRRLFLLSTLALLAGCARSSQVRADIDPPTWLQVVNQAFLDHVIYLVVGAQEVRLGTATGSAKTVLRIPARFIFGPTQLRVRADPIGSNRAPISDLVTVTPGDTVELTIPPR